MPRLTPDELFAECDPRRDLSIIISQFEPEIRLLEKLRTGEGMPVTSPQMPHYLGGDDMVTLIKSQLIRDKTIATFKPIELLSRIHTTVKTKIGKDVVIQEVSAPIHYGELRNEKELIVATKPVLVGSPEFTQAQDIQRLYSDAVKRTIQQHSTELSQQRPTYEDIIRINRRLILNNLRCIPCRDRSLKCFRFDWIKKELL